MKIALVYTSCAYCGITVKQNPARGRYRVWCSDACSKRDRRRASFAWSEMLAGRRLKDWLDDVAARD